MARPEELVRVGVVGAGQLALMMGEAAAAAGVHLTALGGPEDPARLTCQDFVVGGARDQEALEGLARRVEVVTFDHELVDLDQVRDLARRVRVAPRAEALAFAADKAHQRRRLAEAGIPVPAFVVASRPDDPELTEFVDRVGPSLVVKSARGGYDGRGVWFVDGLAEAAEVVAEVGVAVVEERLDLLGEAAQVVVRGADGGVLAYPVVTTVQRDGMCVETRFPSDLEPALVAEAEALGRRLAALSEVVGILAVELFVTEAGLLVNELATRPHNTAHWTIEGCATSQFENHLRAVAGRPLGSTAPQGRAAVMVNLVGGSAPPTPAAAAALVGVHVHDYAKAWREGRKIGHLTVLDDHVEAARVRAWAGADAYGARP